MSKHYRVDRVRKSAEGGALVASQLMQPMQLGPFEKKISEGKMQLGLVGENTIWNVLSINMCIIYSNSQTFKHSNIQTLLQQQKRTIREEGSTITSTSVLQQY